MAFAIDDAIATGLKVLDKFIPDPEAKAQAAKELRDSLRSWDQGQTGINEREAQHPSLFVAGWRPYIGWICGFALTFHYVLAPLAMWVGFIVGHPLPKPPAFDTGVYELVFAMLGIGGLRTYEKITGVARG